MVNAIVEAANSADYLSRNEKKLVVTGSMDLKKPAIKPQFRRVWGDM
jgi:hypothetical protein